MATAPTHTEIATPQRPDEFAAAHAYDDPHAGQEFRMVAIALVLPLLLGIALAGLVFSAGQLVRGDLDGVVPFLLQGLVPFVVGLIFAAAAFALASRVRLLT